MAPLTKIQSFIDRVLESVPEDKKAEVRAQYSAASDEASALDQERARVATTAEKQTVWYNANKAALEAARDHQANPNPNPSDNPMTAAAMNDQMVKFRDEAIGTALGLATATSTIIASHYKEFGEPLDMNKLAQEALKVGKSLDAYYNESVAPRRAEKQTADIAARVATAREEGKAEGVKETLTKIPGAGWPVPTSHSNAPTTLAGLRTPTPGADGQPPANPFSLEAAVATANRIAAQQSGSA